MILYYIIMLYYIILYYIILYYIICSYIYIFIFPTYESALTMPPDILWCHVAYPSQPVSFFFAHAGHASVQRTHNGSLSVPWRPEPEMVGSDEVQVDPSQSGHIGEENGFTGDQTNHFMGHSTILWKHVFVQQECGFIVSDSWMAGGNWILFCNVDPALYIYIQYVNIELYRYVQQNVGKTCCRSSRIRHVCTLRDCCHRIGTAT